MEVGKSNWRILKTLSNCAFAVWIVVYFVDFYHHFSLDESVMDDPTARAVWLQRRHLYNRIDIIAFALTVIFRIAWWIIEYIHDRRLIIANRGD